MRNADRARQESIVAYQKPIAAVLVYHQRSLSLSLSQGFCKLPKCWSDKTSTGQHMQLSLLPADMTERKIYQRLPQPDQIFGLLANYLELSLHSDKGIKAVTADEK